MVCKQGRTPPHTPPLTLRLRRRDAPPKPPASPEVKAALQMPLRPAWRKAAVSRPRGLQDQGDGEFWVHAGVSTHSRRQSPQEVRGRGEHLRRRPPGEPGVRVQSREGLADRGDPEGVRLVVGGGTGFGVLGQEQSGKPAWKQGTQILEMLLAQGCGSPQKRLGSGYFWKPS